MRIRCRDCGNSLGERLDGPLVRQSHAGRVCLGIPLVIHCDAQDCLGSWTPSATALAAIAAILGSPEALGPAP